MPISVSFRSRTPSEFGEWLFTRFRWKVEANAFYEQIGFEPSPFDPMLFVVTLADLEASL